MRLQEIAATLYLLCATSANDVNLYSVDRTIVGLLSNPQADNGVLLLKNIRLYNVTLHKILSLFLQKDMKVATIAEILWERNGPRFLVKRMDDLVLERAFGWNVTDLTTMYDLLNETQDIWRQLRVEYSKMLTERLQQEGFCNNTNNNLLQQIQNSGTVSSYLLNMNIYILNIASVLLYTLFPVVSLYDELKKTNELLRRIGLPRIAPVINEKVVNEMEKTKLNHETVLDRIKYLNEEMKNVVSIMKERKRCFNSKLVLLVKQMIMDLRPQMNKILYENNIEDMCNMTLTDKQKYNQLVEECASMFNFVDMSFNRVQ